MKADLIRGSMGKTPVEERINEEEKMRAKQAEAREYYVKTSPVIQEIIGDINDRLDNLSSRLFNLSSNREAFTNTAHEVAVEGAVLRKVLNLIITDKYE